MTSYTRTVLSACDTAANRPCGSASTRSASPAPSSAHGYALVVLPLAMDQRRRRPSAPAVTHVFPRVSNATPCTTPRGIVSEANALDALEALEACDFLTRDNGAKLRKMTFLSAPVVTSLHSDPSPAITAPVTAASWSSTVSSRRYTPGDPSEFRLAS